MFVWEQKDPTQFDFAGKVGAGAQGAFLGGRSPASRRAPAPARAPPAGPFRSTRFSWGEGFVVLRAKNTQGRGSQRAGRAPAGARRPPARLSPGRSAYPHGPTFPSAARRSKLR